jgi:CRISPR-associated protein Csm2
MEEKTRRTYKGGLRSSPQRSEKMTEERLEEHIEKAVGRADWKKEIEKAVNEGGPGIVSVADHIGKYLASDIDKKERLTRTQIRNVFSAARRMEMESTDWEREDERRDFWGKFVLFKPKIAYATRKSGSNEGSRVLGEILIHAVDVTFQAGGQRHFRNFMNFFEAILAYHVYYGGR